MQDVGLTEKLCQVLIYGIFAESGLYFGYTCPVVTPIRMEYRLTCHMRLAIPLDAGPMEQIAQAIKRKARERRLGEHGLAP
jgi:hypothetical protein